MEGKREMLKQEEWRDNNEIDSSESARKRLGGSGLEIDRYIGLSIFKHFTIIGYRFWKTIFFVFFICHIHNYTEYN